MLSLILFAINTQAEELMLYTHSSQSETYTDKNGNVRGADGGGHRALFIEIVYEISRDVGQEWNLKHLPYIRGMRTLENKKNHVFFNVIPRDENKHKYKWVGPVMPINFSLYESAHSTTPVTSIEEVKEAGLICVLRGTLIEPVLLEQGITNLFIHSSYNNCVTMLIKGRVQFMVLPDLSVYQELIKTGLYGTDVRNTPVTVLQKQGFIAFSKNVPDIEIQKWQISLEKFRSSPEFILLKNSMLHYIK